MVEVNLLNDNISDGLTSTAVIDVTQFVRDLVEGGASFAGFMLRSKDIVSMTDTYTVFSSELFLPRFENRFPSDKFSPPVLEIDYGPDLSAVPEPSAAALLLCGIGCTLLFRGRFAKMGGSR